MTKKRQENFSSSSKNVLWALLVVAAAVTVYGFSQAAIVSHSPSEISPQGAGSTLDSDFLQGLTSADLLAAGGGSPIYSVKCAWSCISAANLYSGTGSWSCSSSCTPPACASGDTVLATGCASMGGGVAVMYEGLTTMWMGYGNGYGYCERICERNG